jgi:hypothetical protein
MLAVAVARWLPTVIVGPTFKEDGPGGSIFIAHLPSKPDRAVMVMPTGGVEQPTRAPTVIPTLQLMVRSTTDPRPGHEWALLIYDALAGLTSTVIDEGGTAETLVHSVTPMQSAPVHIGTDANDRHRWSLNFRLRVHHPTRHRPPYAVRR